MRRYITSLLKNYKKSELLVIIIAVILIMAGTLFKPMLLYIYYILLAMLLLENIQVIKKTDQKAILIFITIFLATLFMVTSINALSPYWTLPLLLVSSVTLVLVSILTRNPAISIISLLLFGSVLILISITIGESVSVKEAVFSTLPPPPLIY